MDIEIGGLSYFSMSNDLGDHSGDNQKDYLNEVVGFSNLAEAVWPTKTSLKSTTKLWTNGQNTCAQVDEIQILEWTDIEIWPSC